MPIVSIPTGDPDFQSKYGKVVDGIHCLSQFLRVMAALIRASGGCDVGEDGHTYTFRWDAKMFLDVLRFRDPQRNYLGFIPIFTSDGVLPPLDLHEVNFNGLDLSYLCLSNVPMVGANLSGCRLDYAKLERCDLRYADMQGIHGPSIQLIDCDLRSATFDFPRGVAPKWGGLLRSRDGHLDPHVPWLSVCSRNPYDPLIPGYEYDAHRSCLRLTDGDLPWPDSAKNTP